MIMLLTFVNPVLKTLGQATVLVRKVLLTLADVSLALTSALLIGGGISGWFILLRGPAFPSAVTFLSASEAVTLEFAAGSPVLPLAGICRGGVFLCRRNL